MCGGLAEYLDVDSLVIRLIFVALLLFGVAPILFVYLIMWIVVPERPGHEPNA